MMADEGNSLSDAQLREQLKLFGVKHGPITPSTKGLLLKKLNAVKSGENSPSSKADKIKKRRSVATSTPSKLKTKLAGFSSDEDEFSLKKSASVDSPSAAARRRSALPRATYIKKEEVNASGNFINNVEEEGTMDTRTKISRRRSLPRTYLQENSSFGSLPGGSSNYFSTNEKGDDKSQNSDISRPNYRRNSFDLEEESEIINKKSPLKKRSPEKFPNNSTSNSATSSAARSPRLTTMLTRRSTRKIEAPEDQTDSEKKQESKEMSQDNGQEDEELELAFATSSSFLKSWRGPAFFIFVIVLLVCLVGSYVSLWSNRMSEWPALPDLKGESSVIKVDREQLFTVLQCVHEKLSLFAGEKECGYPNISISISGDKLESFISEECSSTFKKLVDYEDITISVVNLAIDQKYSRFFSVKDDRKLKIGSVDRLSLGKIALSSKMAVKPFTCRLSQAAQMLSKYILGIFIGLGTMLAIYYIMKRRWVMDDEDTRLMFIFVERIIETLRRHHDACQHDKELPPYLPIPHLRDMLIPSRERKQKARAWKRAIDFLSSTDSRIRVETQIISGEDFDVLRWIGVMTPDKKVSGANNHLGPEDERGKFWQGPAFDKLEKVVRMPIITPTPCLKIRYLHGGPAEKEENWDRQVRDALLEKCTEDGARILHAFVDAKSPEGCVYVKCDSLDSAGKAFRSVYGNWFDGRLVIVKFVTVARYHQRFPDALTCTRPLKVSGEFPSSLSWNNPENESDTTNKSLRKH